MKRLLSWLTGILVMAGLLMGLLLPASVQAADIRNVADDKIAERGEKVDLNNSSVRRFQRER
jgi:photosystem II PsbU protein